MAGDTRGSGCAETFQNVIYVDNIPMSTPRKDFGCQGDVHIFSVVTTLPNPTYSWHIDTINNPAVSTKSSYGYTFDDKKHQVIIKVNNTACTIQSTVTVTGKVCQECKIECVNQTAFFRADELVSLIDTTGKVYKIDGKITAECKAPSRTNANGAKAVSRAVKAAAECSAPLLNAQLFYNKNSPNCLTLQIINSPIKFKEIQVGTTKYPFSGC
jgi:hypothetical protein